MIKQNHPENLIHDLLENALTDFFLILPASFLDGLLFIAKVLP